MDMVDLYFSRKVDRTAAALTYYLCLTFFPALVCVSAILGLFSLNIEQVLLELQVFIPEGAMTVLMDYLKYVSGNQSGTLLAVGLTTMIWFASAAMRTLMGAIDELYGKPAYRGIWFPVASVAFSALFLVAIYLSLVVVLTGNWLFMLVEEWVRRIPLMERFTLPRAWQWVKYLLLFVLLFLVLALIYRATTRQTRPRPPVLLGSFLASLALVVASVLFSALIGFSSRYSLVYGSLASLIILMLWLYLCSTIVILGACFHRAWYGRIVKKSKS